MRKIVFCIALVATTAITGTAPALGFEQRTARQGAASRVAAARSVAEATYSPRPHTAAQAEKPSSYFNGCHSTSKATEPHPCDFGSTGSKRRVLLFGDSQAAHLQPALHEYGRQYGVRVTVITKSACPAVDVSAWWHSEAAYRSCPIWRRAAMAKLRSGDLGHFDVAVISSSSRYDVMRPGTHRRLRGADRNKAWREGTARTLAAVRHSATRTIVVRAGPILRDSTMSCLIRKYPNGSGCATPVSKALFATAWRTELAAAASPRTATLDLSTPHCTSGACRPVAGRYLAFRDPTHWSRTYSARVLSKPLGAAVRQQMPM